MANGASRIWDIMFNTSKGTNPDTSKIISLTVKSTQPLVFIRDDKLEITNDFYIINSSLDASSLQIDDIVIAFVFNNGQQYFIQQLLEGS